MKLYRLDGDHNPLPPKHIAGTEQYRLADPVCNLQGIVHIACCSILGERNVQGFQEFGKFTPVFCKIDPLKLRTEDMNPSFQKSLAQFEGGLAADLKNHPFRFFMLKDIEYPLPEDRFKVEFVGKVKVGRDGLRVAVDHDRFITHLLHGQHRMYTRVVKLNSLADPVGPAPQ